MGLLKRFLKWLFLKTLFFITTVLVLWLIFSTVLVFKRSDIPVWSGLVQGVRYTVCSVSHGGEKCSKAFPYGEKFLKAYKEELKRETDILKNCWKELWNG